MFFSKHCSVYKCLLGKIRKLHNCVKENYPNVDSILFDRQNKWTFTRYVLSCLYGIFIAFILWEFIICDLDLPIDVLYCSLIGFIVSIGLGYTFSKRIRCIVILTCLSFWGKSGRSFLRAIIYALIIAGPIKNMTDNGRETIRVFSCSAVLTYNLTKTRFDLMTRPFLNAIVGMKKNMTTVKDIFKDMESVVEPIVEEIEEPDIDNNQTSTKRNNRDIVNRIQTPEYYQGRYTKKIERRCERQLEKGEMRCKEAFAGAYQTCYDKLPAIVNTLFCWPMKITVVCDIKLYMGGGKVCDPRGAVDERLGENYYHLRVTEDQFMANLSAVQLKYKVISPKEIPGVKGYVNNIEADNIYVTDYFKRIDERRRDSGKRALLPLKKVESREIIDPTNYRQSKSERSELFLHMLKLSLELITALLFLILDHIIYELLGIIRDNARIEYYQDGEHVLHIRVNGTGIIANLIRATLKGFNTKETIHIRLSNEQCLPVPRHLPFIFYAKFAMLYLTLILLVCNQRIIYRMRHVVCAYFYGKQEKRRILHLYNKLLKRRKLVFVTMQEVVRVEVEKHRVQHRLNIFVILRMKYPKIFGWLRNFPFSRRSCLICREPEPKKYDPTRPLNFADCATQSCYFTYCEECWFEAGGKCLACEIQTMKSSSKITLDDY